MASRGTFIAIEGIDGSGKRTQTDLLGRALEGRGVSIARFSFPRYESSFGHLIADFLNGSFGSLEAVDPHFSALLYAGDRFEAKPDLEAALAQGRTILTDRYIGSNLAHQTARMPAERQAEFRAWLRKLEYGIYGLPVEDLVIYLRLGVTAAQRLVSRKAPRKYTQLQHDLQEADADHLEQAAAAYDALAGESNWVTVECLDPAAGAPKAPQEIHKMILAVVEERGLLATVAR